ncbi:LVIVD repeat-containing protein [Peristeroidobacter agariperforans]|uniref:LVIVD repeat-containing protein n=1 Tax=Peristeroidobacter agariperforans TaxID=268404 RepID=UPI00101E119E|nr:hypothetical protein [Peristeroidobacter agariperforans]
MPRAVCGPQDRVETVQGQTTLAERFSSNTKAFSCNLDLIGQFEGEGAGADVEAFDSCAYFSTAPNPKMKHPGVAVLEVSDSRRPKASTYLASPAMLNAHESLEIAPQRRLLVASTVAADGVATFDVYDIAECRQPVLKSSTRFPEGIVSHAGRFSADGLTFYGARWEAGRPLVFALDTSDPTRPRTIATWTPPPDKKDWMTHSAVIDRAGRRVYVALKRVDEDTRKSAVPNGLAIFDAVDVQARRGGAQFRLITTLFWDDTHGAEGLELVRIKDRDYLIFSDNLGALGNERLASACKSGRPAHGLARIIDVTDDAQPRVVAKLVPEVAEPTNCQKSLHDPTQYGSYGSFACSVDDEQDGKLLACGNFEAGVRVFDIREPERPREVAYYKPPARRTQDRPGSLFRFSAEPGQDYTADSVLVAPKFRENATEIWFTSADNGFQIVRFSDQFRASNRNLFKE